MRRIGADCEEDRVPEPAGLDRDVDLLDRRHDRRGVAVEELLPHGEFLPWISAEFEMSD